MALTRRQFVEALGAASAALLGRSASAQQTLPRPKGPAAAQAASLFAIR